MAKTSLHIYVSQLCSEMKDIFVLRLRKAYPHELVAYITTECNFGCPVCYIDANHCKDKELFVDDILRIAQKYKGRFIHFSGGEPTIREDLFKMVKAVKNLGFKVGLFSNGSKFGDYDFVCKCKEAGVDLIILSFEGLNDDVYLQLKGQKLLSIKLKALENIRKSGINLYLFCSVAAGVNDSQIVPLLDFAIKNMSYIDIINFTPIWKVGRFNNYQRIPASEIYSKFSEKRLFLEDFIKCTEFSHLSFEIISKLCKAVWTRHPPCEQIIYLIRVRGEVIKITDLLNLDPIVKRLRRINKIITGKNIIASWFYFLFFFPWFFCLKCLISEKRNLFLLFEMIFDLFNTGSIRKVISSRKITVMTGQVHGTDDTDLRFLNRCTLYAINKEAESIQSFCTRQLISELGN